VREEDRKWLGWWHRIGRYRTKALCCSSVCRGYFRVLLPRVWTVWGAIYDDHARVRLVSSLVDGSVKGNESEQLITCIQR